MQLPCNHETFMKMFFNVLHCSLRRTLDQIVFPRSYSSVNTHNSEEFIILRIKKILITEL